MERDNTQMTKASIQYLNSVTNMFEIIFADCDAYRRHLTILKYKDNYDVNEDQLLMLYLLKSQALEYKRKYARD